MTPDIEQATTTAGQQAEEKTADAAFDNVVNNCTDGQFDDWPNEAGFLGLTEVQGPIQLVVKGKIPSWAAGALYRTGPGQYEIEDTPKGTFSISHWFDGLSQSHKFDIIPDPQNGEEGARVEYTSRRQSRERYEAIRKTGVMPTRSFAQRLDPCIGIFGKAMSVFQARTPEPLTTPGEHNISVAVLPNVPGLKSSNSGTTGHRAEKKTVWQTTDAAILKEVDAETLEPIGLARQENLHPLLTGPISCAHAQRDPHTGDVYNFNLDIGRYTTYRIFRASAATGQTDILATICQADAKPAYIHSFFLTSSFVVFGIPSSHLGWGGISVPWQGNVAEAIEPFDAAKLCKWFVIDRRGDRGVVATFESPAGFYFHTVNAFEETCDNDDDDDSNDGEDVVILADVIQYPTLDIISAFYMDVILRRDQNAFWGDGKRAGDAQARLIRHKFRVPAEALRSGSENGNKNKKKPAVRGVYEQVSEIRTPRVGELPTINPAYATRPYRYAYSIPSRGRSTLGDALAKTDVRTGETVYWDGPRGHTPGEAIFVARPSTSSSSSGEGKKGEGREEEEEKAEDDGVLLSVVLDGFGRKSYLLCLDARDMTELGRAECGFAVGLGFHGVHVQ
ncbi:carotenoid oxygenase [Xylariomycetidae sp. FL2044]|nr:carotenoid oxygenase [Xylariomycetidae sp. FL2044]